MFAEDEVEIFIGTGARPVTNLGHQGGQSFLRVAQIFQTMSNTFKLYPTYFSSGGKKFSGGPSLPLVTGLT